MIGWITEPDRRKAVLIHDRKTGFELFGQEFIIFRDGNRYLLRVPYGAALIENPIIEHQTVTVVRDSASGKTANIFWSIYENGYELFHRVSWRNGMITVGNSIDDDIYLQDENLRPHQFLICRKKHQITDQYGTGMGDLSGTAVTDNIFQDGDRFRVLNVQILLFDMFFAVSSAANTYCTLPDIHVPETILPAPEPSFEPERSYQEPAENLQAVYELDPPPPLENTDKRPLLFMMGPALMMSSASLITGLLSAYNGWLSGRPINELAPVIILPSVMVLSALLWNPLQRVHDRRTERNRKCRRNEEYKAYLHEIEINILRLETENRQRKEARFNPSGPGIGDLWRAQPYQPDFLNVRLGTGEVRCDISFVRSFRCTADDPAGKMITALEEAAGTCRMPVLLSLNSYRRISITYDENRIDYLIGLFLQLLYYHGPDVLNIVLLGTHEIVRRYPWITEIPHLTGNDGLRRIVFTSSDAAETAASMKLAGQRATVIICFNPSLLSVFEECNCTVIFPVGKRSAPADAELRINLNRTGTMCSNGIRQIFDYDPLFARSPSECIALFKRCRIPHENRNRKQSFTFFDLYDGFLFKQRNIEQFWQYSCDSEHLYACIGIGDDGETIRLDLSENGNGPHGLIAGMTGSGKSELIITLLLSLCVNYSPREFQFVMVDFKGGGASALFSSRGNRIKHAAGILSNLDEADIERALVSFQNECLRREQLFSSLSRTISRPVMNLKQYQNQWTKETGLPYLASLLIVIDEFAELKKEQPEVMRDLISVARVGRSLGIHMILATQKPGGIVDEQIWSNTRFKLCLKVQEKADSTEMIQSPDAAFIRRPGEGFLLCDGIRTHFQCGYANALTGGERKKIQMLDTAGRIVREEAMQDENSDVQSEYVLSELCRNAVSYDNAYQLWCDPIEHLCREDLPEDHKIWLGMIDDYRRRSQIPYCFGSALMAVFSADREEKQNFLRTLLAGMLECAEAQDEIFILDDLDLFEDSVTQCGTVCAQLSSNDEERCGNLIRHMMDRERGTSGICTLIITETASFYEINDENRLILRSLITTAELRGLRLILCFSSVSSVSYRDLSMIRERIALRNDSLQDLSAIFEQSVHRRVTKKNTALCMTPELSDLCFFPTSGKDMERAAEQCAERLGTTPRFVIPVMPAAITLSSYNGTEYAAGIDMKTYEWVEIPKHQTLVVLATYEDELYGYHEIIKKYVEHVLFLPELCAAKQCIEAGNGSWIFLTAELYEMYRLRQNTVPVLYIGSGFNDQYRFTFRSGKDVKDNQGILFQRGRNRILQLIERS